MADFILIDGDAVLFQCNFEDAMVVIKPGKIKGTGAATQNGKKLCIEGDEKSVKVEGCDYMTPAFPIPGKGTMTVSKLGDDQVATKTNTATKPVLLKGKFFEASFKPTMPAKEPPKPGARVDDKTEYKGQGQFLTNNKKYKGT